MNRLITFRNLILAGFTCLLAASCSEDDSGNCLPDGKYPMTFTAGVEGLTVTRATVDGTWAGNEAVAVQVGSDVKEYTVATNGNLTVDGDVLHYWNSIKMTVSAWYCKTYFAARPTTFTVAADQSSSSDGSKNGYQQSDFLYTPSKTITFSKTESAELTFKHLPAKVVVNLKAGKGVAEEEVTAATVRFVNVSLTSGTIAEDGTVTQATTYDDTITPANITSAATGYQKSIQALLVPQQMQEQQFIKVTISGYDYYYTPTDEIDANLTTGKQYTYAITVNKTGLEVKLSDTNATWTGGEEAVTGKTPAVGFSATNLKIGDYYYSDGNTSDGGYRKYSDGTITTLDIHPVLTDDGKKRTVLGIVLKVDKEGNGDWIDDCSYKQKDGSTSMPTIRGYVLALHDANGGKTCKWGPVNTRVETNTEKDKGFYGYKNTQKIKEAAETLTLDNYPAAYYATVDYETRDNNKYAAPTNSSGWFLPSAGQCLYWHQQKDVLLPSIKKATGKDDYNWQGYYWSSSERSDDPTNNAWYVDFDGGLVGDGGKDYYVNLRVRSCLAF